MSYLTLFFSLILLHVTLSSKNSLNSDHRFSTGSLDAGTVFDTRQLRTSLSGEALNESPPQPTSSSGRVVQGIYVKGRNSNRGRHRVSLPAMGNYQSQTQPAIPEVDASTKDSMDFPFLQQNRTKHFMKCSKVMIIMRGLPGSGKTYLSRVIYDEFSRGTIICSSDDYFNQRGMYRFNPSRLPEAHGQCQQRAVQAVSSGRHLIIIDNTNVELWEMEFYVKLANANDYIVLVIEPKTAWKTDVSVLSKVTSHNIEEDKLLERKRKWQRVVPLYYGWFLNYEDSFVLIKTAMEYFEECYKIKAFNKQIQDQLNFSGDTSLEGYYNLEKVKSLHVTAKYLGNVPKTEINRYQSLDAVKKAYGSVSSLKVIGFVLTPYTLGARVTLNPEQLRVWGSDDEEKSPPVQVGLDVMRNSSKLSKPERVMGRGTRNETTCIPTMKSSLNPNLKSKKRFYPSDGVGRRAHITLGCAHGVQPVQTGFDLLQAIDFERETHRANKSVATYQINGAVAKKYGEDIWVIYPEKVYALDAMFAYYVTGESDSIRPN